MTPAARLVVGLLAIASFGGEIRAQPCDKFDVASIKLNTSGGGGSIQFDRGYEIGRAHV